MKDQETDNYVQQAQDLLAKMDVKVTVEYLKRDKHFRDDEDERDIYRITFSGPNRHPFKIKFGQSINSTGKFMLKDRPGHLIFGKRFWRFSNKNEALASEPIRRGAYRMDEVIPNPNYRVPSEYDAVTCLTKSDPGSFENFCWDFGYDEDSRRAKKTYKAVMKEWLKVSRFFRPSELNELNEIQ